MKTMDACTLALAMLLTGTTRAEAQSVVRVAAGDVRGADGVTVDRFLGVPYAQAPVSALRWRDPVPATKWTGVRDASHASAACYQAAASAFGLLIASWAPANS